VSAASGNDELPNLARADWLTAAPTRAVFAAIIGGGHEARAVGGVVRNALMGLPVTDIDVATTALPDEVMRLAQSAGLGVVATGLKHGTVTVIAAHHPFEVTTLRADVESHGRHATVAFTNDWEGDARRRDFTINALYCGPDGKVWDPVGGYPDLVARRVRFIGDARARITEDYLRMLRFFRFTATYGVAEPDPDGLGAVVRERDGLRQLSAERVRQELVRILVAPRAIEAIGWMSEYGILSGVLAAAPRPTLLARLVDIEKSQTTDRAASADAALRLAALGVETLEDADRLVADLRLSGEERHVLALAALGDARLEVPPSEKDARRLLYRHGVADYQRLLRLSLARCLGRAISDAGWQTALRLPQRWPVPVMPVRGGDLVELGLPPGPRVGEIMRMLETRWIETDFTVGREALLQQARDGIGGTS
jgi:poly(A) polymerase